jgi:DNA-binding response OmpR family regulator
MATILIVDDDPDVRSLYSAVFVDEGYRVALAENCAGAESLLKDQQIDLVVLDIQLKQESGLVMLQHILKERPSLPVILCSACNYYKHEKSSWQADAYIVKSSDLSELKAETERLLSCNYLQ